MRHPIAAIILFAALSLPTTAWAQNRVALVVGNDRYTNLPADKQLTKAVNDARAVGATLERMGFKVIRGENLTRAQMVDHLFDFTKSINPGDTAVMFFAGHGVSLSGGNYLLPTDIPLLREGEEARARNMAIGEADILGDIEERKARVTVMMLDACRDNPFRRPGLTRSLGNDKGLARGREAQGVFTIYSAGFGQSALDRLGEDDAHPNSVFTRALIPALTRTDTHLADIVIDLREKVAELAATVGHPQYPAYYDQTRGGRVYLAARTVNDEPRKVASKRVALLIGINTYPHHFNLSTPGADVDAVAALLREARFNSVTVRKDLTRTEIAASLRAFAGEAAGAELALIYFSGHGARLERVRFVLGSDLNVKTRDQLIQQGVTLTELVAASAGATNRLLVVDGNQQEPFSEPSKPATSAAEPIDTNGATVIYSAGPTESALDGSGSVSPFTAAFVQHFREPGISLGEAFSRVQRDVSAATKNAQTPVMYGAVPPQFSLLKP